MIFVLLLYKYYYAKIILLNDKFEQFPVKIFLPVFFSKGDCYGGKQNGE